MTCDLANPIFTDEAKATAHMEADRWPDGAILPSLRLVERPQDGWQNSSRHVPL